MSLINVRQLNAYWIMGWALVKHIAARPFLGRNAPEAWLSRLAQDSLACVPKNAWELFAPTSRCIGCGICDALAKPGESPTRWILSIARQPADSVIVEEQLSRLAELSEEIEELNRLRWF